MSAATVRTGRGERGDADGTRGDVELRIDGSKPLTMESVAAVDAACTVAESTKATTMLAVHLTGTPGKDWTHGLEVALVSKWERSLRRLERLTVTTVAVASGDCGGLALDALLAADYRIATPDVRLSLYVDGEATWPGMAIFRLAQQAGGTRLRRAILFGAHLDATESVDLGIVDEVTNDPTMALTAAAEMVSGLSGREVAVRRQLMFDAPTTSFEDALGRHLAACDRALRRSAGPGAR
ncbi:enoyl-CoA-hydratase DpgB [Micromonospora sp. NPDC051141]|uniref:enoyl-CoA-hydratase DpgB n=1 Tax=Micromonospora sp. NPDC051141 TaxID=3364284 RepID=UPI0037A2EC44